MTKLWLSSLAASVAFAALTVGAESNQPSAVFEREAVLAQMQRVADWQLAQPPRHAADEWTSGAMYVGMLAMAKVARTPKYHDAMMEMGRKQEWKPGKRVYDADDQCVCQTYLDLYLQHHEPAMIRPTQERFDFILAHPSTNNLMYPAKGRPRERWLWCDALFMAPPAWVRMYAATGEKKYLDFMDREWWATSDFLYDKAEHLYYRDNNYFDKREANGKKVFWSRGNGWVLAGLGRVIELLPSDFVHRKAYEGQYREMAERIAALQQPDGLWHSSLLDPESYPLKEASGSGFFTYGLVWGINHRMLDRKKFEPVVRKSWQALLECVTPEGKLEHIQPIGSDPKTFDASSTEVYGVGAFLLAGSEMYRLAGN